MKSIISGAVMATAIVACLTLNVQARSISHVPAVAVSDTGKMMKDKMKMSKMKKDSMKMAKDKMKMGKKKMSKDTAGKM
jgi:hypothetical protein